MMCAGAVKRKKRNGMKMLGSRKPGSGEDRDDVRRVCPRIEYYIQQKAC